MRRIVLTVIMILAALPWMDSHSARRSIPSFATRAAVIPATLRDLVPASALLAIEVRDLDRRWTEIRAAHAIAHFQDSVLSCFGIKPEQVPMLAGEQAVLFLAPLERPPFLLPIALLRPADLQQAESVLRGLEKPAVLQARGALWIGPAGSEGMLEEFARTEDARLGDVLPLEEIEERLPRGGLIRGWVNPGAWVELLRNCSDRISTPAFQWAASAAAAELEAVRYIAFRRDVESGELEVDGLIAYDVMRLPPEVARILDPDASAAVLPPDLPSNTLAVAAFRPEPSVWMPWLRYLAARDARGPLRNLGFWIDEFQQRYRRDLDRDLFQAFGDRAWLIALLAEDARSVELAWVFEVRETPVLESTLLDLVSWLGGQIRLRTLGTVIPEAQLTQQGVPAIHGLALRTPFLRIQGPDFQIADGYLVIAGSPATMQSARALVEKTRQLAVHGGVANSGLPVHGVMQVRGAELARLIGANTQALHSRDGILDAIAGLAAEFASLRIEMRYERDAIRFHEKW
jgi:hypothetical protein